MIAKNFKRYAEALLCQLELPLHGIEHTIQGLSDAVRACYRRSILAGTWAKTRFLPKTPTPAAKPRDLIIWHQLSLLNAQ